MCVCARGPSLPPRPNSLPQTQTQPFRCCHSSQRGAVSFGGVNEPLRPLGYWRRGCESGLCLPSDGSIRPASSRRLADWISAARSSAAVMSPPGFWALFLFSFPLAWHHFLGRSSLGRSDWLRMSRLHLRERTEASRSVYSCTRWDDGRPARLRHLFVLLSQMKLP